MAINNQDKTEIHNLPEVTTLQPGMMVAVDSEPTGSKSFNLTTALGGKASADDISALEIELAEKADASEVAELATAVASKADASEVTSLATTVASKADASEVTSLATTVADKADSSVVDALATTVDGKADEAAMTTALAGKEDKVFVAEVNVTSYDDIDAAYNAGKTIVFKYQPAPQGNPGQVYYIKNMQYIPYAGYMCGTFDAINCGYFIVCDTNNGATRWTISRFAGMTEPRGNPTNGQLLAYNSSGNVWIDSPVPSSTASDSGKVLSVDSAGTPVWTTIASSPFVLLDRSVSGWYSTIPTFVAAGKIPMFYDMYTYENVQRNILYVYQYTDTSSNYVFMGTGIKIPDLTPSPKYFYVTYTLDTSTGNGGVTSCDANGIGEETINSTSRLSGDTLSIDNNRAYKITIPSILAKNNLIIKIEDTATSGLAANVSVELTPTTNMTLTVMKWNTTLKYSVAAGNQLTAGKTYQVTAFGGCWTMAEFQLPS